MSIFSSAVFCAACFASFFFYSYLHFPLIWLLYCCGRHPAQLPPLSLLPFSSLSYSPYQCYVLEFFSLPFAFHQSARRILRFLPHCSVCVRACPCVSVYECVCVYVGGWATHFLTLVCSGKRVGNAAGAMRFPCSGWLSTDASWGLGFYLSARATRVCVCVCVWVGVAFGMHVIWCGCDFVAISLIAASRRTTQKVAQKLVDKSLSREKDRERKREMEKEKCRDLKKDVKYAAKWLPSEASDDRKGVEDSLSEAYEILE